MSQNQLPRLCFVHLPRTGGRSFASALRKIYGSRLVSDPGSKWWKNGRSYRQLPELVVGHSLAIHGHFPHHTYPGRPLVTWLRDPVERLISCYRWLGDWGGRIHGGSRRAPLIELAGALRPARYYIGDLSAFEFVGVCERREECLVAFERRFGLQLDMPCLNVSTAKEPEQVDREALRKALVDEYALYWRALEEFGWR